MAALQFHPVPTRQSPRALLNLGAAHRQSFAALRLELAHRPRRDSPANSIQAELERFVLSPEAVLAIGREDIELTLPALLHFKR